MNSLMRAVLLALLLIAGGVPEVAAQPEVPAGGAAQPEAPAEVAAQPEAPTKVAAQPEAPAEVEGDEISRAELKSLIATLEDPKERRQLLEQLRALAGVTRAGAGKDTGSGPADDQPVESESVDEFGLDMVTSLTRRVQALGQKLSALSAMIVDMPDVVDWVKFQVSDPTWRSYWTEVLGGIALVLLVATAGYQLVQWRIRKPIKRIEARPIDSVGAQVSVIILRSILRLVPIAVFGAAGFAALAWMDGQDATELVAESLVVATVTSLVLVVSTRMLLAPHVANLRPLAMTDETAAYLYGWLRRFIYLLAFGYVIFQNELLLQIPNDIYDGIERVVGLVVALLLIVLIVQNRTPVSNWLRGSAESSIVLRSFRRGIGDVWHFFAVVYVLATYFIWVLDVPGGFELLLRGGATTAVLLVAAQPLAQWVRSLLSRQTFVSEGFREQHPALIRRVDRYIWFLRRVATGLIYLAILIAIVLVWGIDPGWIVSDAVFEHVLLIAGVVVLTVFLWELGSGLIENYLEAVDDTGTLVERSGRARTLLPLLRTVMMVVITVLLLLTALSALGINIAPLLAAAGVVGIAVGFGSQKLVQDVINGLFILLQDTIAVGDVVEVGGHAGSVERISVRTIDLRDLGGNVHTIPFSEVTTITNKTKGFSFAEMEVQVAYRENVDDVMEVIRQVGAELDADPEFGQYILEPMEVLGVDRFDDSAVVIKARIKTKSLRQWYTRREFNRRLKLRFDEVGIEIPFPHQTIYFGEDKSGAAPPMHLRVQSDRGEAIGAKAHGAKPLRVVKPAGPKDE